MTFNASWCATFLFSPHFDVYLRSFTEQIHGNMKYIFEIERSLAKLQEWRICAPGLGSCTRLSSPVVVQRAKGTVGHSMHFCLLISELLYSVLKAIHQVYFQVNKVYFPEQIIHVVLEVCFFVTSSCYSDFKAIWWLESQLLEINKLNVRTLSSFCSVNVPCVSS